MAVKTWAQLRAAFADNNTGNITAADMRDLIETIASVHFTARVRINGNIDTSPDGLDVTAAWPETGLCHITCPSGFKWVAGVASGTNLSDHRHTNTSILEGYDGRVLAVSVRDGSGTRLSVEFMLAGELQLA